MGLEVNVGGVVVRRLDMPEVVSRFEELHAVYRSAHPEQNEQDLANFRARAARQSSADGFDLVAACEEDNVIAFAYGLPLRGPGWWKDIVAPDGSPVPEEFRTEPPGRTFAVIELVVRPDRQGHGLGRQLLTGLLEHRSEERATLAVDPDKPDNVAMYERWGWQNAGRITTHPDAPVPFLDLYWLSLNSS